MAQIEVSADRLRRGQRVTNVPGSRIRYRGQWPTVVDASEGPAGVIQLELSDRPGNVLLLPADELVTVEATDGRVTSGR